MSKDKKVIIDEDFIAKELNIVVGETEEISLQMLEEFEDGKGEESDNNEQ